MGFFDFIASIVQSVAWPSAIFGSVYLFRKELVPLLPRMRVKYKDAEVSFRLDEAEKGAAQLPPSTNEAAPLPSPTEESSFKQLARISPRAAMLETRAEVEEMLRRTYAHFGYDKANIASSSRIIRDLVNHGIIGRPLASVLEDLRLVGNNVAHNPHAVTFSEVEAIRYRDLANLALAQLNEVSANPPQPDIA